MPRTQHKTITETGLSKSTKPENLDAETRAGLAKLKQNDAEIDDGLDEISNSLSTLANISKAMNEEVSFWIMKVCASLFVNYYFPQARSQTSKLESLTNNMDKAADKQAMVNAHLKRQLK